MNLKERKNNGKNIIYYSNHGRNKEVTDFPETKINPPSFAEVPIPKEKSYSPVNDEKEQTRKLKRDFPKIKLQDKEINRKDIRRGDIIRCFDGKIILVVNLRPKSSGILGYMLKSKMINNKEQPAEIISYGCGNVELLGNLDNYKVFKKWKIEYL